MTFLRNLFCGAVIGVAEIIPGVSGGTMAVLLGIYDKLIGMISHLKRDFTAAVRFLFPLVAGMGISILALSHLIGYLLAHYPMAVNFFFLGLVLGILPMLLRRANAGGFRAGRAWPVLVTLGVMVLLTLFSDLGSGSALVTELSLPVFLRFMAVGFLAAVCLILPGISGSMIMVIFGTYDSVIEAIRTLNILMLLPVGIGVLLGLVFGSKMVDYCLRRFPCATYWAITGLVVGSVFPLFLRSGFALPTLQGFVALFTLAAGVAVSLFFTREKAGKS